MTVARIFSIVSVAALLIGSPPAVGGPVQRDSSAHSALVELGRRTFFSTRLSADGSTSCASCHQPEHAFADARPVSPGVAGRLGQRNAPSLLDVGDRRFLFWDGRASDLEAQALQPLINVDEQGFRDIQELGRRVAEDMGALPPSQRRRPTHARVTYVLSALAAFERTLRSQELPVDRLLRDPNDSAVAADVRRGFEVFRGVGQCVQCHRIDPAHPALTDDAFHLSANGVGAQALQHLAASIEKIKIARQSPQPGALGRIVSEDADVAALGRFVVTGNAADIGKFKTPGLRSAALTAPYMHDGSVASLHDAMEQELYRIGGGLRRPIPLGDQEKHDLLAFLNSLAARQ